MRFNLEAAAICVILKACKESGVTVLEFGKLKVQFGTPTAVTETLHPQPKVESPGTLAQQEHSSLEQDELDVKKDELDHMLVENPLEYENALMTGDLEDEAAGTTGDGGSTIEV